MTSCINISIKLVIAINIKYKLSPLKVLLIDNYPKAVAIATVSSVILEIGCLLASYLELPSATLSLEIHEKVYLVASYLQLPTAT